MRALGCSVADGISSSEELSSVPICALSLNVVRFLRFRVNDGHGTDGRGLTHSATPRGGPHNNNTADVVYDYLPPRTITLTVTLTRGVAGFLWLGSRFQKVWGTIVPSQRVQGQSSGRVWGQAPETKFKV